MIKDYRTNLIPREHHAFLKNKKVDCDQSCTKLDFSFFKKGEIQNSMSNRNLAAKSLGCDPKQVCFLNQIHSSKVLVVDSTLGQLKKPADGMVTNVKGVGLAILTADCAPVLFFDPIAKIIGAAHAGWRGARQVGGRRRPDRRALGAPSRAWHGNWGSRAMGLGSGGLEYGHQQRATLPDQSRGLTIVGNPHRHGNDAYAKSTGVPRRLSRGGRSQRAPSTPGG